MFRTPPPFAATPPAIVKPETVAVTAGSTVKTRPPATAL